MPDQLFYNTGISTYFWVVSNRKRPERQGKVQLIDVRESWTKMRKSLGNKRKQISAEQIDEITRLYGAFEENERVKVFPNEAFGFMRITVERPLRLRYQVTDQTLAALEADKKISALEEDVREQIVDTVRSWDGTTFDSDGAALRKQVSACLKTLGVHKKPLENAVIDALAVRDPDAEPITDKKSNPQPDPDLRDNENVPLPAPAARYDHDPSERLASPDHRAAVNEYVQAEVRPYVPDAWVDHTKTKIGYEIPLTRHFYTYKPPRPLHQIDAEIKQLEHDIQQLLAQVTE